MPHSGHGGFTGFDHAKRGERCCARCHATQSSVSVSFQSTNIRDSILASHETFIEDSVASKALSRAQQSMDDVSLMISDLFDWR